MKLSTALTLMVASLGVAGAGAQQPPAANDDPAALRAEIERLKSIMPGQATAMTQVAYNFNNLWFAAHAENWPLAQFYANETRARLRWALRITPVRKIASGDLELQPFLDELEKDSLAKIGEAVTAKNVQQLETAYRATLEACHACHTASEKPYLDLQVPTAPAEPLIRFTPR
ncbi:MAG TPA: hypothetical protein VNA66_05825 [Gammaproteobacteria bacterium]|nr:hypothetical protein [Gammaproteobacteria bacterium]